MFNTLKKLFNIFTKDKQANNIVPEVDLPVKQVINEPRESCVTKKKEPVKPKMKLKTNKVGSKKDPVPTGVTEVFSIIESKNEDVVKSFIIDNKNNRLILENESKKEFPLVKSLEFESDTPKILLEKILSIRDPKKFKSLMTLYKYMLDKGVFELEYITGIELARSTGKNTNQRGKITIQERDKILSDLMSFDSVYITIFNPELTKKENKLAQKNNDVEKNVYKKISLLSYSDIGYTKDNTKVTKLFNIKFMPEYTEYLNTISKRYLPLDSINTIQETTQEKTKIFLYKLAFLFASKPKDIKIVELDLRECKNLAGIIGKDRHPKAQWKKIELALMKGVKAGLLKYQWVFNDNVEETPFYNNETRLDDTHYKHIQKVRIERVYVLEKNIEPLELPINIKDYTPEYDPSREEITI